MSHPPVGGGTVIWFDADITVFQMCNLNSAYLTTHFGVEGAEWSPQRSDLNPLTSFWVRKMQNLKENLP